MKCIKCQNDTFDKSVILAKTLDIDSKYNPKEYKLQVFRCRKCNLTQWYDYGVLSEETKTERKYEKSIYSLPKLSEFECLNCQSHSSGLDRIAPFLHWWDRSIFMNRYQIEWSGEMLFRVCKQCGLIKSYEIILTKPLSSNIRLKERIGLAESFNCPICKSKQVSQTGIISFWEELPKRPKYRQTQQVWYLFGTCKKCKYIMAFGSI